MSGTRLDQLNSVISVRGGFAWNYKFKIASITSSNANLNTRLKELDTLNVAVVSTKLPGVKLNTTKVSYGAFDFNVPMNVSFPDNTNWQITLMADAYGSIRGIYSAWQESLYNFKSKTGNSDFKFDLKLELGDDIMSGNQKQSLEDALNKMLQSNNPTIQALAKTIDTSQPISMQQLKGIDRNLLNGTPGKAEIEGLIRNNENGKSTFMPHQVYTLKGCYPTLLDSIQYTATSTEVIRFGVTLAFQYFETAKSNLSPSVANNNNTPGIATPNAALVPAGPVATGSGESLSKKRNK